MDRGHRPVLLEEAIAALMVSVDGTYVDGTFGRGGHATRILESLSPQGSLLALDQDPEAARRVIQALGPDVRSDLVAEREFWRVSRSSAIARGLGEMAERGNDLYLRGQGQEGGVASYGRAVDLLLAALAREVSIKGSDR